MLYLYGQAVWTLAEFAQAQPFIEKALEGFRKSGDHEGQAQAIIAMANSALMLNELDKCRDLLKGSAAPMTFRQRAASNCTRRRRGKQSTAKTWRKRCSTWMGSFTLVVKAAKAERISLALMLALVLRGDSGTV